MSGAADLPRFSFGSVLGRSFSIFSRHLFLFWGLFALARIPGFVFMFMTGALVPMGRMEPGWLMLIVINLIDMLLDFVLQGAAACGVFEALRGGILRFGGALSRGMSCALSLLGASISMGLCFMLLGLAYAFLLSLRISDSISDSSAFLFYAVLGPLYLLAYAFLFSLRISDSSAFLISAVFALLYLALWCKWCVFVPACAVERLRPLESLDRSSELTKGCRLKIAGLHLICLLLTCIFTVTVYYISKPFLAIHELCVRQAVSDFVVKAVSSAFVSVVTAVLYYSLRDIKEGVSIKRLAKVAD